MEERSLLIARVNRILISQRIESYLRTDGFTHDRYTVSEQCFIAVTVPYNEHSHAKSPSPRQSLIYFALITVTPIGVLFYIFCNIYIFLLYYTLLLILLLYFTISYCSIILNFFRFFRFFMQKRDGVISLITRDTLSLKRERVYNRQIMHLCRMLGDVFFWCREKLCFLLIIKIIFSQ